MSTKITHPAAELMTALLAGTDHAASPSGSYERVMVGKKSAAWVLPLKKGGVRLILRTDATPPKALSEGSFVEAKTGHTQFRLTGADLKRGRQLIEWAVRQATPTEAQASVLAAAKTADKPVARPRTRKPALKVVKSVD